MKKLAGILSLMLMLSFAAPAHADGWDWHHGHFLKFRHVAHFHHAVEVGGLGTNHTLPFALQALGAVGAVATGYEIATAENTIGYPFPLCGVFGLKCYYDGVNQNLAASYPQGTENVPDQSIW